MDFKEMNLSEPVIAALEKLKYSKATEIQQKTIPLMLSGENILACAATGTGKTAAYLIPVVEHLKGFEEHNLRVLVLSPTRELAQQILEVQKSLAEMTSVKSAAVYGGVELEQQLSTLSDGVDVLIATPGRLLDLMERGAVALEHIEMLILDEADRMLDMGFSEDISKILKSLPEKRQVGMFSATVSQPVRNMALEMTGGEPFEMIDVQNKASEVPLIEQRGYYIEPHNKPLMIKDLLRKEKPAAAIIFTKTRKSAEELFQELQQAGFDCDRLHSERSQNARESILERFRSGELPLLIATDIAARGIDISHLSHVFNYELPQEAETFVHRIGRTGRAGRQGIAITLCSPQEKALLVDIQKLMRRHIPIIENHTYATLALKTALDVADGKISAKNNKPYMGSKANGDYFRRQKMAKRKNSK